MKSEQEKREIVEKVKELRSKGMSRIEAYRTVGVSDATYYSYAKSLKARRPNPVRKKRSPNLIQIPISDDSSRLVILIGKSSDVTSALDRLSSLRSS